MVSTSPELSTEEDDWPAQMADTIERVVGSVRDKTTGPLLTIARAVVYGTVAAVVGLAVVVVFVIAAVRFLDNYLPSGVFGDEHTWVAHLLLGLLFTTIGIVLWARRR